MRISVRNGLVPSEVLDVEAWPSDTVASLKDQVCRYLAMDPAASFIAYQGYSLDDDMRLQDLSLSDGAELLVMARGTVGGK